MVLFLYLYLLTLAIWLAFFFFNDTATTEIYTLSLHDALPIYILDGLESLRRALDGELPRLPHEIFGRTLEQVRGDLPRLLADLSRGHGAGGARHRRGAAGVRAPAVGRRVRVALPDLRLRRGASPPLGAG